MNPKETGAARERTGRPPGPAGRGVFARVVDRVTGISLFIKVMGIALALIALFGVETIIETRALMRDSLEKEAHGHSLLLARQLESSLIDRLITGDLVTVYGLLKATEEINPGIKYLFILSPQKRVLVSTTEFPLSRALIDANETNADGSMRAEPLGSEWGIINDLAAPIMGGRLGTLRIGISQDPIKRAVNVVTARLLLSGLLVALLGAGISYLLAFILSKPINNLIKGIDQVEKGDLDVRIRPWFSDEIGRLTDAFNKMAGVLGREKALKTELVRKLLTSQEEERQRISRELHDKTSQSLTSIKIGLKVLETQPLPREALAKFGEFRALLNSSLDEIHELAVELRPPALVDLGLPQVVKELGENFQKAFSIEVKCFVEDYFIDNRLEPEIEIGLYRIIQEAFSNIEKHSGADAVEVRFAKTAEAVLLTIGDNGRGFCPAQVLARSGRKPIGLFGMKERAEILGGKFSIAAREGGGTELTVSLPAAALSTGVL